MKPTKPVIWLVIGDKLGDNAQAKIIADSLGLPYETRRLLPKEKYVTGKPRFRVSLDHLDPDRSDPLTPPWPDLVITVGRRHAMAALWIKARNPATRIVLLGRPRRWIERFDLVIIPPQYAVPAAANVLQLSLPLLHIDQQAIHAAAERHRAEFARLPRPVIAVLVGGPTRPFRFDTQVAKQLIDYCRQLQRELGGSLYITTSRRTPAQVRSALEKYLPEHALLHQWSSDDRDNPFPAMLGLADCFVVTGDSVSMLMEVAGHGKPLAIFPLPSNAVGRFWQHLKQSLFRESSDGLISRIRNLTGRLLYRCGLTGFSRDLTRLHARLVGDGHAVIAGHPFRQTPQQLTVLLARQEQLVQSRMLSLLPAPCRDS